MPADPMSASALLHAVHFDEATDVVDILTTSDDVERICEIMDQLAQGGDLTHAVLFRLWCRLNGFPDELGIQIATKQASSSELILPPGAR